MYLLGNEYNTNENFRTIVDVFHENKMIPQYIKYLNDINSKNDHIYNLRTRIIVHYIENPTVPSENTYNVACNISYIYEHFLLEYFSSSVYTKKCNNPSCASNTFSKINVFLPINLNLINIFDLSVLEDAISLTEGDSKCASCYGIVANDYAISKMISFDLNGTNSGALSKVPRTISFKNKMYKIIGTVEYVPSLDCRGIGHYKSHYLSNDKFYCYDDNCTKSYESTNRDIFLHSISYILINS